MSAVVVWFPLARQLCFVERQVTLPPDQGPESGEGHIEVHTGALE